ncbi:DUF4124 domain-containing protein [Microbulbifer agarilyticus]|uniref:DUF4124 domain-containing protein n=1 Tax=Microbulbifer agarilyticus TaxID=260552 RepID=A0A1Q2M7H8_9GAMM|nr:DUF4124 domain-containing protein [Microbulbifer agarilyticus]AQQ68683.1 DUF4124 domain-containing protein [Microbulbifer agarilyticus]
MRTLLVSLSLSLGLMAAAHADGIYKWVDENGVVHFGSQPPQKGQVEVVKAPKSERFRQWQNEQQTLQANRQLATEAKPEETPATAPAQTAQADQEQQEQLDQAEMAARAQRCQSAQRRLQELEARSRVREVDASGNYRVLGEDERQQRIQQTREILLNNC